MHNLRTKLDTTNNNGQRNNMKHLDLFSGIGGFALAASWAGWETVGFSEIDEYANKVLAKHWPNVKNYGDIKNIEKVECDIITGGFPCQPFSVAGRQQAQEDDRHLWPQMLRVIKQCRPSWVLAENVSGLIKLGLDEVQFDLENEGYTSRAIVVPACAVDAPHRRDRVWIVAYSEGERCNNGNDGKDQREDDRKKHAPSNASRAIGGVESGRWPCEPPIPRVANGIPFRMDRNRALGNAIVPEVAYHFMDIINQFSQKA